MDTRKKGKRLNFTYLWGQNNHSHRREKGFYAVSLSSHYKSTEVKLLTVHVRQGRWERVGQEEPKLLFHFSKTCKKTKQKWPCLLWLILKSYSHRLNARKALSRDDPSPTQIFYVAILRCSRHHPTLSYSIINHFSILDHYSLIVNKLCYVTELMVMAHPNSNLSSQG